MDLSEEEQEITVVKNMQASEDDVFCDGIIEDDLYYHISNHGKDGSSCTYYVYHGETAGEETLPEPPENYLLAYMTDSFVYFSVFDEDGTISNNSGHVAAVSLQDFRKGKYTEKGGQPGQAAGDDAAAEENALVWGVIGGELPDSAAVEEINRKLASYGFEKQISFITVDAEDREQFSAEYLKENYPELDILQVPGNLCYENRPGNLMHESYFENLKPYLQGEGKELYQSVHENSWKQVGMGDAIYTVPSTFLGYQGLYAVWNRKYISNAGQMAETFTIEELEEKLAALDTAPPANPVVFIGTPLTVCDDTGWMDGETNLGLYYGPDCRPVPWYQAEEVKGLFQTFHRWQEKDWLSDEMELPVWGESCEAAAQAFEEGEYVLALGYGSIPAKLNEDEVAVQRISRERISQKLNLSTGVAASSDCKEEAERFLQLVYTDREIADLMFYGVEGSYEKEKGLVTEQEEEFLKKVWGMRLSFGNQNAATPLADDPDPDPDAAQAEYYADRERFYDSATLGFVADTRGYEDTVQQLVELEEQYLNIWKSEDFEQEYRELCEKLDQKEYREYSEEINRQMQEWKKERQ